MEIKYCPNCGCGSEKIEVAGNKVLCRICEVVFEITDKGARPIDTDPLTKDRDRISHLEEDMATVKQRQGEEDPEDDGPEPAEEKDDDGFIVFDS